MNKKIVRVLNGTSGRKTAHGLLASVDDICESGVIRLSIREFAFGVALDGFGIHAAGVAKWQTHRT